MAVIRKRVKRSRSEALQYLNKLIKKSDIFFNDTDIISLIPLGNQRSYPMAKVKITYIDPFKIRTEQESLYLPALKKKIQGKFKGHNPDIPIVYKNGKSYYVTDGNHRVCAALLLGNKRIRVLLHEA